MVVQRVANTFMPILSVVMPAYNEEQNIVGALDDVLHHVASVVPDLEIICVNDGSSDGTARAVRDVAARDPRVRLIDQVNQGHGAALINGIAEASGEWLVLIDSDRQVALDGFDSHWKMAAGRSAILGIRRPRHDPPHRLLISLAMRMLLRARLGVNVTDAGAPYKLVKRDLWSGARALMRENCWVPSVLLAVHALRTAPAETEEVTIVHQERPHGPSRLNLKRLVRFCREGVSDVAFYGRHMK